MEIERKFLVKKLPDLSNIDPVRFERYYLNISDNIEERIQNTNGRYTYEKKVAIDELSRSTERKEITKEEFEKLRGNSKNAILRSSYALSPHVSVKIYHGNYEGLIRVEAEFPSMEEAKKYTPAPWMGEEISHSPLGRDSRLLQLDSTAFEKLIHEHESH